MGKDNGNPPIGEAYDAGDEIVILGEPPEFDDSVSEDDPRRHNCDAMGCGTFTHVLYRFPKPNNPLCDKAAGAGSASPPPVLAGHVVGVTTNSPTQRVSVESTARNYDPEAPENAEIEKMRARQMRAPSQEELEERQLANAHLMRNAYSSAFPPVLDAGRGGGAAEAGDDPAPEFEPCDVCGGTEADFDGFCPQCELPMELRPSGPARPDGG